MKYNNNNKPIVCMQTNNQCYKNTSTMQVKGILWHSTGANNPTLKRYVQPLESDSNYDEMIELLGKNTYKNDWNHIDRQAGMNCWIGQLANGEVTTIQTMPWNYRPWGCGSGAKGSCNDGWIQFEICEDNLNNKSYFDKVYKEGIEITAYLCKMFNINPLGSVMFKGVQVPTILCHQDSYRLGLGSNHGDVYNWFNRYGKTMQDVREDVAALLKKEVIEEIEEQEKEEINEIQYIKYNKEDFVKEIAKCVREVAPKYGIKVYSPIIAQAILESSYGKSNKATYNNYFGLKYRDGRVSCHCGTFMDVSKEQLENGDYIGITDLWYAFKTMKDGVEGYMQFINIDRYANLKGVTDPKKYLELIKKDGYATSKYYVDNVYKVIQNLNLTKYDDIQKTLKVGDIITLKPDARYYNGKSIPNWVKKMKIYYRGENEKGIIFSILKIGAITGIVKKEDVIETTTTTTTTKKSNEEIAKEVVQGKWGNGMERKEKLTAAGYDYSEIQTIVNKLCK
jgi:flagellum-specific peptidoglycan hydrolase FlgJ